MVAIKANVMTANAIGTNTMNCQPEDLICRRRATARGTSSVRELVFLVERGHHSEATLAVIKTVKDVDQIVIIGMIPAGSTVVAAEEMKAIQVKVRTDPIIVVVKIGIALICASG
jgi:hypothetical protein